MKGSGPTAPLQVIKFVGTRADDPDRGPAIWLNSEDAKNRLLISGELAWVYGPRRHELATVGIDDELPKGSVVARDIAGIAISEVVRVIKPDLDKPTYRRQKFV